ncbi:hypothetical protein XH83_35410 (plasmid) [Bradyrhizobium sp. CCBAU 53351]|uniref:Protein phosphatase 2C domain-containing protein n=2 Tax=Bradyrhizobium TaxID=374 RepID=A0AAE6CC98_9BRAD|nr:hypothetical protein [Bradyrhizobium sp. WYCCWR 12699]QAU43153.1 hypothetical protein X265_35945 [Bradyrhizobium guangdongense]QAU50648.1 hypothetical protein XH91_35150 [Bradyrhizobium guangzhouense]QOZ49761.1 hypothetical protein XH89_41110 [Bradyrhizobium sp. CCBAU 53340]QOZ56881.1 hypothetical protein XH90_36900 [Bradyrhizobium sp. CCBAU 53338]QOZ80836.1 hypothetical protein XH83_35410 [Bradyrhizobium sp. CCBAU 53351]
MAFAIQWHSQQGTRTTDNRDCAGIGIRQTSALAIVLDGSTSGAESGAFAHEIARRMVDWYVSTDENITAGVLTAQLRATHAKLSKQFRRDSASYLLMHVGAAQTALVLHAGDCLVGRQAPAGPMSWLTQPHTLANSVSQMTIGDLANDSGRHRLTRSFRSREFVEPAFCSIALDDTPVLVATDGFWAELDHRQQSAFIHGRVPENAGERRPQRTSDHTTRKRRVVQGLTERASSQNLHGLQAQNCRKFCPSRSRQISWR